MVGEKVLVEIAETGVWLDPMAVVGVVEQVERSVVLLKGAEAVTVHGVDAETVLASLGRALET